MASVYTRQAPPPHIAYHRPMPYSTPTAAELTAQWEGAWENLPDAFNHRMRRALSWLGRAEKEMEADDPDAAFIFYWIAFNAAYAQDRPRDPGLGEQTFFIGYFRTLLDFDSDHVIYNAIWERFSGAIRILLENQFVFQPFWNDLTGKGDGKWEERFEASKRAVHRALANRDTLRILRILFSRLYTLRIQLMHGGATWSGSRNRRQVEDGTAILALLVPAFIQLMMEHPDADWGQPYYPVVRGD